MAHPLNNIILLFAVLAIPAAPVAAHADTATNARAEAKKHFDRATELNEDGQVAEAVIELKRAYEIAPHHTVLYNLGQAYITLAKPVEAMAALQRYLDEGGKAIKPARRAEVEREIARQKTRIATLEIRGLPDGALVTIDGDDAGRAPLAAPVRVGVGKHLVTAMAAGYEAASVAVTVAGEDRRVVELTLSVRAAQTGCTAGYHDGGAGTCVANGVCSAGTHNDGRGTCVAVGCARGYLLAGAQCLLAWKSVSSGGSHTCGVRADNSVTCWGGNRYGQTTPPAGTFASVSAGKHHTCGVNTRGTVACWGRNDYGQSRPLAGTFASVSAGYWHTCGVRTDSSVACWGYNRYGQATPPAGSFRSVSAGEHHTCGVQTDGTIACWGRGSEGQATPPAGTFVSVGAGQYHTCGVRNDGSIVCWGVNLRGQAAAPDGTFVSVSAGEHHTCAVKIDDTIACWGWRDEGQATPPAGSFVSVSAGKAHTCGVRADGKIVCWGDNEYGQTKPPEM
jgi:hypothetical protein